MPHPISNRLLRFFAFGSLCLFSGVAAADDLDSINGFLESNCVQCHNDKKTKGGINLKEHGEFTRETVEHWQEVLDNLQRGDMPPEDEDQPSAEDRQQFLAFVRSKLDRVYADSGTRDFRFTRLTNQQIAWSLKDILKIDRDFSRDLIEDPVGPHGESLQSTLELTGGHMEVYLNVLQKAVEAAVPDLANPPEMYSVNGNDWEKQHYLNRNDLAYAKKRKWKRYDGPNWLEDDFEVPLPPNHFFRMYLHDNRSTGQFRAKVYLRNEPPQNGGELQKHEMTVFMDKGFKSTMHGVDSFTVEAKKGTQVFEVFGNVQDFPGVDPSDLTEAEQKDAYLNTNGYFKYRILSLQNCSPPTSPADKPVTNQNWIVHGDAHLVRADDAWIDAWGNEYAKKHWLKRSHAGSDHQTRGKPAVFKEVMKDTGHVIVERIEFDLPWQWPVASVEPFLEKGKLTAAAVSKEVKSVARRAWRRNLTEEEDRKLNELIAQKLKAADSKAGALRDLLTSVFADSRFLFYTDIEKSTEFQNYELVSRLAGFLWRSVPDYKLLKLAYREKLITDAELRAEVTRMVDDPKSERFVADFTASWMGFSKLEQIAVNPNYYGWWNPQFKHYMKLESVAFLSTLLHEDLSCLNCLSSDFIVVNDMMAKYYGVPKPESGHRFSRVPAPADRGGVLTQPAFLLAHSTGEDSHAVNRGVWVRGRLLGDPPRDPPPTVPALDDLNAPDAESLSTTDRLALHAKGTCYDCHQDIDPWGVAMESFDATGKPRKKILKIVPDQKRRLQLPVVDKTEIRDTPVAGMAELRSYLREHRAKDFSSGFSGAMLSFALARPLSYQEDDAVRGLADHFEKNDYRMSDLIEAIVLRPEFRHPNNASEK